nr:hypothetical protein [Tanacetum cinerariifolium]GEZ72292.1 hypothetical protein [Tanacetum cinerariifolium]
MLVKLMKKGSRNRICTSYRTMMEAQESVGVGDVRVSGRLGDSSDVEFDGEVVLVSNASMCFDSSSVCEVAILLALPTLPPSLLTLLSSSLPQIPSPQLPISSPPLPLPSPTVDSPTYVEVLLGYRVAKIRIRAASPPLLLPSTSHRTDILKAKMPPRKRASFTTPASKFKVEESSVVGADRQPGLDVAVMDATAGRPMSREVGYGITDTCDDIVEAMHEIALTTLEGVNQRVTELATTVKQDTNEFYMRFKDA